MLKAEGSIDITKMKDEDKERLGITSEMANTDINKLLKVRASFYSFYVLYSHS